MYGIHWSAFKKTFKDEADIEVVWCPSHCWIHGNEQADKTADEGLTESQKVAEVAFEAALITAVEYEG